MRKTKATQQLFMSYLCGLLTCLYLSYILVHIRTFHLHHLTTEYRNYRFSRGGMRFCVFVQFAILYMRCFAGKSGLLLRKSCLFLECPSRLIHFYHWLLCEFTNISVCGIIWAQGKCTNLYIKSKSNYKYYVFGYKPERK